MEISCSIRKKTICIIRRYNEIKVIVCIALCKAIYMRSSLSLSTHLNNLSSEKKRSDWFYICMNEPIKMNEHHAVHSRNINSSIKQRWFIDKVLPVSTPMNLIHLCSWFCMLVPFYTNYAFMSVPLRWKVKIKNNCLFEILCSGNIMHLTSF